MYRVRKQTYLSALTSKLLILQKRSTLTRSFAPNCKTCLSQSAHSCETVSNVIPAFIHRHLSDGNGLWLCPLLLAYCLCVEPSEVAHNMERFLCFKPTVITWGLSPVTSSLWQCPPMAWPISILLTATIFLHSTRDWSRVHGTWLKVVVHGQCSLHPTGTTTHDSCCSFS